MLSEIWMLNLRNARSFLWKRNLNWVLNLAQLKQNYVPHCRIFNLLQRDSRKKITHILCTDKEHIRIWFLALRIWKWWTSHGNVIRYYYRYYYYFIIYPKPPLYERKQFLKQDAMRTFYWGHAGWQTNVRACKIFRCSNSYLAIQHLRPCNMCPVNVSTLFLLTVMIRFSARGIILLLLP